MKSSIRITVIALLLAFTTACGLKSVHPEFCTIGIDTLILKPNAEYNICYRFTSISNADKDPAFQAIEQANIHHFFGLEEFSGTATEAIAEARAQFNAEDIDLGFSSSAPEQPGAYSTNIATIESHAEVVDSVLVYTITSSSYMGGAHGNCSISTYNYSLPGGYELSLGDLFSPAQRASLDMLIRHSLYDHFQVQSDSGLVDQGFFPDYIRANENFAIAPDSIVFYYNPYDIGCYALGIVRVPIAKNELRRIP